MSQEKSIVAGYIEQVDSARSRAGTLSEGDLHSIASELGLSAEDLAEVEQIAADHLTRGEGYLQHDLLEEAIEELTLAVGLRPLDAAPALLLARAHAARWRREGRTADRERATVLAHRSLALDPESQEAYALLGTLKPARSSRSRLAALIAAVVLVALLGGGVLAGLMVRAPAPPATPEVTAPAEVSPAVSPSRVAGKSSLPVTVVPSSILPDLTLDTWSSELQQLSDSASFRLSSELVNGSDQLLKSASGELLLIAQDGSVVYQKSFDILGSYHPRLRPGDRHAFYHNTYLSPLPEGYQTPVRAEVRITEVSALQAAASYPEAEAVPLDWDVPHPAELEVSLHQRSSTAQPSLSGVFHRGEYEVRTTPQSGSIERLKLRITYLDADGGIIGTDESYAVASSEPPMPPGSVRLVGFIESLSAAPAEVRISVIDVR